MSIKYSAIYNNLKQTSSKMKLQSKKVDYSDKTIDLTKLKQCDLKGMCRYYQLRVSGNKSILIMRISAYFFQDKTIVLLQKVVRGFFVRLFFKVRGNSFKYNVFTNYVNDTDFYTMDPLKEIDFYNLYTYTDEKGFTYGFNIQSLVSLYFKTGRVINPYNRNKFPLRTVLSIFSLYGMIKIVFGIEIEQSLNNVKILGPKMFTELNRRDNFYTDDQPQTKKVINNVFVSTNSSIIISRTRTTIPLLQGQLFDNRQASILQMSSMPIYSRIEQLFIEIDQLGNYTRSSWFSLLSPLFLRIYYHNLKDI